MSQKALILAVETSSRVGSVAIATGEKIHKELTFSGCMRHSAEIFPAISTLLDDIGRKPRQIDHIYISNGPGSFTGLRIAVTLAKTMYLANGAKVIAVDTLDVIASNMADFIREFNRHDDLPAGETVPFEKIAAVLDAKRGQFYVAVYKRRSGDAGVHSDGFERYEKILPDSLITAADFLGRFACPENPIWLLGDGLVYHRQTFESDGVRFVDEKYWSPRAIKVHLLGRQMAGRNEFADPVTLTPYYLSRPGVTLKSR